MTRSEVFKPYDNPAFIGREEESITDEQYHRGIEINTYSGLKLSPGNGAEPMPALLVHISGLSDRGGKDVVCALRDCDPEVATAFFNSLLIQIGVAGLNITEAEGARIIRVPIPKYRRSFLPPYVALIPISSSFFESLSSDDVMEKLNLETIPEYAIILSDKNGVFPGLTDFDEESVQQFNIWEVDLSAVENGNGDESKSPLSGNGFDDFTGVLPELPSADDFMTDPQDLPDLTALSMGLSETNMAQIRADDEAWELELETGLNSVPETPVNTSGDNSYGNKFKLNN